MEQLGRSVIAGQWEPSTAFCLLKAVCLVLRRSLNRDTFYTCHDCKRCFSWLLSGGGGGSVEHFLLLAKSGV